MDMERPATACWLKQGHHGIVNTGEQQKAVTNEFKRYLSSAKLRYLKVQVRPGSSLKRCV